MRNVFVAATATEAALVRNLLVSNGIEAQLVDKATTAYPEMATEVWIPRDHQHDRAIELIRDLYSESESENQWSCASCAEKNPAQFELCWSCGKARD